MLLTISNDSSDNILTNSVFAATRKEIVVAFVLICSVAVLVGGTIFHPFNNQNMLSVWWQFCKIKKVPHGMPSLMVMKDKKELLNIAARYMMRGI
jgi:hypothetical protein